MTAAILRLPPELLADIFLVLAVNAYDISRNSDSDYYHQTYTSGWIVSHVCGQWRDVALSTPALWSYLDSQIPFRLFSESLFRSEEVPLNVSIGTPWCSMPTAPVVAVAQNMHLVRELKLVGWPKALREACEALTGPAPILHKLAIICNTGYADPADFRFGLINVPVLRHLKVVGRLFDWAAWKPPSMLTTLVLKQELPSDNTLAQLIAALERTPRLRTLRLKYTIPSPPPTTQLAPGRVCRLDNLQNIELKGTTSQCASLLLHLSFPLSPATSLCFSVSASRPAHLADLRETLAERISALPPSESLTLFPVSNHLFLDLFPRRTATAVPANGRGPVRILIKSFSSVAEASAVLSALLPAFAAIRRLCIRANGVVGLPALFGVLRPAEGAELPLPRLREVALDHAVFKWPWEDGRPSFEALRDWLMERCDWDVPVDTLRIERCEDFDEKDRATLGEIVADVSWDGVAESVCSEDEDDSDDYW